MGENDKPITIVEFLEQFPDDTACLAHIFDKRFGQGHQCPKCGNRTKWSPLKSQRAYCCHSCGYHLHPTVGTVFERSRTPLRKWFFAIFLFASTKNGVSAKELQRQLGVTYKCAWRMGHKIRQHMASVDRETGDILSGHVEIDETFVGGEPRDYENGGHYLQRKAPVLGMVERQGRMVLKHIPDTKGSSILPLIWAHVDKSAHVSTDEARVYKKLDRHYYHGSVNHKAGEFSDGIHHTNTLEGFWSLLKRSIRGTHVFVSHDHLQSYLGEFAYRFNCRHHPERMFPELISFK